MKVTVKREVFTDAYTTGKLYVDGVYECDTLEDTVRDLNRNGVFDNGEKKIFAKTAIPFGTYSVTLKVKSPKFSKYPFYMEVCEGKLPRLLNVNSFEGILLHVADGNRGADLLEGCIGVGHDAMNGHLAGGKLVFRELYKKLKEADYNGEKITIEII